MIRYRRLAILGLLMPAGACDIPTEAPTLETQWVIPGVETTIGVGELLPPGVSVTAGGASFLVATDPATVSRTLGEICPPCEAANGLVVPKPAFSISFEGATGLPDGVQSAVLEGGSITVRAAHDFSFDPIRPGGEATGLIAFTVRSGGSGGAVIGADTVRGAVTGFPPGVELTRVVPLRPGAVVESPVVVEIDLVSPAGSPTRIDTSDRITVSGEATVRVAEATVDVTGRTFTVEPATLDVADVDESLVARVERGALVMRVTNPFGVGLDASVRLQGAGVDITKQFSVPADPLSTVRVDLTGDELRSFLGSTNVVLSGSGSVAGSPSVAVLRPDQVAIVDVDLEVTLSVGG